MKQYVVFTFPSTYHALKAEKVLHERGITAPLAPIPRELAANCGEVIKVAPEERNEVRRIFENAGVEIEGEFLIEPREKKGLLDKFFGF